MSKDILNTAILAASFLALFGIAELLYHLAKVKVELTRKLVHFGTGILTLLFPLLLTNHWYVLFLCASFAVILIVSLKFKLLQSINAIDRDSWGSLLYPVAVYGTFLYYAYVSSSQSLLVFYLPILVLAICDPVAALVGKSFPLGKFRIGKDTKTLMGCSGFFISCLALTNVLLLYMIPGFKFSGELILFTLVVSLCATLTEALSGKGIDNLTIPACVIVVLYGYGF